VQARDASGDDEALDLRGALEDRVAVIGVFDASVQPLPVRIRVRRVARNTASFGAL
jgi:hypothetical protein